MITSEERVQQDADSVTVERTVSAPPSEVYRAFTTPQALRDWFCDAAQVDAREGGRIYMAWTSGYHTAGKFTRLEKNNIISYTWHDEKEGTNSQVTVEITDDGNGGSNVRLTHDMPHASQEWRDEAKRDWNDALEALQSSVEKGIDLRLARRPMFGLTGADLVDEALVEKFNLPVRHGIRLNRLAEGMGAEKAGIQVGDVLAGIAGKAIVTFNDLGTILNNYRAGDTVETEIWRDGEKLGIPVTLTGREMPTLPETAQELAEQARKLYDEVDEELTQLFEGVTEAQADYRPSEDEWNSKEILGHLVASERDVHAWVATLAEDFDLEQPWHSNDLVRVRSIVAVHPTAQDMVNELKQAEAEVVAAIGLLRTDAVGRKHMFRNLALWLTSFQPHHREHFELIKTLLEAGRE